MTPAALSAPCPFPIPTNRLIRRMHCPKNPFWVSPGFFSRILLTFYKPIFLDFLCPTVFITGTKTVLPTCCLWNRRVSRHRYLEIFCIYFSGLIVCKYKWQDISLQSHITVPISLVQYPGRFPLLPDSFPCS